MQHGQTLEIRSTRRGELFKFLLLLLVFLGYFAYLSWEYSLAEGSLISALTWSFFVLCTPVADAGFLLDFPVRMVTGIRMVVTEVGVWLGAFLLNVVCVFWTPEIYQATFLTSLFYKILVTPWPYWNLLVLCGIGTFLSIYVGDEILDAVSRRGKGWKYRRSFIFRLLGMGVVLTLIILGYWHLLSRLGLDF